MAPSSAGTNGYKDAKDFLDKIGQQVHEQVKNEAKERSNGELKGNLASASIFGEESASTDKPCNLIKNEGGKLAPRGDPCGSAGEKRFSKERVDEYDEKKIKDNKSKGGNNEGECAPYRRLSLCKKNMEKIPTSSTKHDLLLDVCYAANYEAESLIRYHPQYQATYGDSQLCTVLARSFADIGDIIRGRDLYGGSKKEKDQRKQLDKKLKEIFENIKKENNSKLTNLNDDQIREDWWEANRKQIWQAMTCSEQLSNASYFRTTCSDEQGGAQANKYCRCKGDKPGEDKPNIDPPTYFDYVPQFLRWFEEWAEDFCRKKKKKLQDVKTNCRGTDSSGKDRYCSRNGFDCEKTKRAIGRLRMGKGCTDCFFACNPYVDWIDKKKEEFDKQKNKYETEISDGGASGGRGGSGRKKRDASNNYEGYEKKFYKVLQSKGYETVDAFLGLLNNEKACQDIKDDKEGGKIDFKTVKSSGASGDSGTNVESQGTFYRSDYCQPCPHCGVKKKDGGSGNEWEKKNDENCKSGNIYKPKVGKNGTPINFLYSGDEEKEIAEKLNKFCQAQNGTGGVANGSGSKSDSQKLYEEWKCYQREELEKVKNRQEDEDDLQYDEDVKNAGGLCILKNEKYESGKNSSNEPEQFQKTYNDFFNFWVAHMLKDSIYWRTKKIKGCLKNGKKKCGNEQCKVDCKCFESWVGQKKEQEWKNIKIHFKTQNIKGTGGNGNTLESIPFGHDELLQQVLEKDVLLTSIKSGYGKPEDIGRIEALLNDEEEKNKEEAAEADGNDSQNKTTIDKLLKHELNDAKGCIEKHNKCQDPKPEGVAGDRARSGTSPDSPPAPTGSGDDAASEDAHSSGDESEEEEEEEGETKEEAEAPKQDTQQPDTVPQETTTPGVKPACDIVDELFKKPENLSDACTLKYGPKAPTSWKCIPTTSGGDNNSTTKPGSESPTRKRRSAGPTRDSTVTATGSSGDTAGSGSICVPPRRRKLYIHDLQSLCGEDGKTQSHKQLLEWFVESAAVETFFLWHRYKKENTKKTQDGEGLLLSHNQEGSQEVDPEEQLKKGEIPEEFKRQMFYTLGDYRDILFSGSNDTTSVSKDTPSSSSNDNLKNIVLEASGSTKEEKEKMNKIQQKIKDIVEKPNGVPPPAPGEKTTPTEWWQKNGEHIWKGMVCALTYKDSGTKGGKPQKIENPQNLWDDTEKKPKKDEYQYKTVELKEEVNGAKTPTASGEKTTLTDFISRPPYFRYLEEWGQNFCKERKKRLAQIYKDCKVDKDSPKNGNKKCSGYGEDCEDNFSKNSYDTVPSLECPDCGKHCRYYKKWIKEKRTEFDEQKSAYGKQKDKCVNESNKHDKEFCRTLETTCTEAKDFLKKLGPCSKTNNENGKDNQEDEINFNDPEQTFKHTKHCDPCSQFKVKCEGNGNCSDTSNGNNCNGGKISAEKIGNGVDSTHKLDMRVSDNNTNGNKFDDLPECENANIFKGIRKEQWNCYKVCGYVVCKPENGNGRENQNKIITIRALVTHWVQNFLDDYNRIKHRISHCINNSDENKCKYDCPNKCKCVKEWVEEKREEWDIVKKRYLVQYENADESYPVKTILEELIPQIAAANDKRQQKSLEELEKSLGCNCIENSKQENGQKRDVIDCMIKKLEEKAKKCEEKHPQPSVHIQAKCEKSPNVEDDDEPLEEENPVIHPQICKDEIKAPPQKEEEIDGTCEAAENSEETAAAGGGRNPEQTPVLKPEEEAPAPDEPSSTADSGEETNPQEEKVPPEPVKPAGAPKKPPEQEKRQPLQPPQPDLSPLKTALVTSTLAWSVGIGFAAFTYFYLKKKTKSSVGNLFQILQIPKGDYDISTLKSKNRYIPYRSGTYKGKTYIYMEGDTSGDEKYAFMSDTTDVTSSESEYEELDINDIYVPGSPKYKTLIEVVLEPSGKTQSGNNIPSGDINSGDHIPSDNTPTPSPINDDEWNQLKKDFISNMLQNTQNTEPNILRDNVDNNTHPTTSHHNVEEKPFIMSIHDRNLFSGEEISYNVNMVNSMNDIPMSGKNDVYSGIDLINDSLNSDQHIDIYDEVVKRKENELFGTNNTKKNTSTNSASKLTNSDPITNQLELFHKWLDRHRHMCDQWNKNKKEELLDELKEEWNKENNNSSAKTYNSDNKPSHNHVLNTDVSIQIDMDNLKPKNEFTNMDTNPDKSTMDTILDDLEKYNEPYYYDFYKDDIYYDVNDDDKTSMDNNNNLVDKNNPVDN
ncbi:hypothetical protein PFFCH_00628 [Plasmodium falciparum FCH/4]|uniref:Erythrocyte membrane protein 1 n=1 Tax=Plasmodium falciparum FCH/4 TaxID=1036724 RepID=A0A024VVR4_PLAFA|nr:hypothetical protein PFFCH_00628 [Plasmodium falciparum FCH/4]